LRLVGWGLLVALLSALVALFLGKPLMTGVWFSLFGVKVGTPVIFDIGVYLTVFGALLSAIFGLEETADRTPEEAP
jgi:hypothetical protein